MNKHVFITKGKDEANFFRPTKNPKFVQIMVQTEPQLTATPGGAIVMKRRVAFPIISKEVFDQLDAKEGTRLNGQIVQTKANYPLYEGHKQDENPNTGELITDELGQPVFSKREFTTDMTVQDKRLRQGVEAEVEEEKESQTL